MCCIRVMLIVFVIIGGVISSAPPVIAAEGLPIGQVFSSAVTALGYGSVRLTGWAAYDVGAMQVLGVRPEEKIAGFIHLGTAREYPPHRRRPTLDDLVTSWTPQ
jgi:nitroreductase